MVHTCCVPGCSNRAKKGCKLSFHSFPTNEVVRKQWLHAVRREKVIKTARNPKPFVINKSTKVCSDHFLTTDYWHAGNVLKLRKNVVPSLFAWTKLTTNRHPIYSRGKIVVPELSSPSSSSQYLNTVEDDMLSILEDPALKIQNNMNVLCPTMEIENQNLKSGYVNTLQFVTQSAQSENLNPLPNWNTSERKIEPKSAVINFEDKNSTSGNKDKINFSANSDGSFEDDMPAKKYSCSSQEKGSGFLSVLIKCEETEISDCEETKLDLADFESDTFESKPQILYTANTNEQFNLDVSDIKSEPFEIGSHVKQEFVSNQETGLTDVAIKYEEKERNFLHSAFSSEEIKIEPVDTMINRKETKRTLEGLKSQVIRSDYDESSNFNTSNANISIKCDPLAADTYIKQENEVYIVDPSFSTFSDDNKIDHNSEDDRSVSINGNQSEFKVKNKTPFQCEVCNKTFTRSASLKTHILTHTGEKPYRCDTCDKTFTHLCNLRTHKLLHSGTKPYQCDVCHKSFNHLSHLKGHKRTHTGEKPYKCEVCSKTFSQSHSLSTHKRTHTGENPYRCDICNKTFSQLCNLSTHKLTHTGEKPYKCEMCYKTFNQSSYLNCHKRIHTGEKPYQCDVCDMSFTQSSNLHRHKLRHN